MLLQRKELTAGHEVLCELASAERAMEISLAENNGREAMRPADEFEAFHALASGWQGRCVLHMAHDGVQHTAFNTVAQPRKEV